MCVGASGHSCRIVYTAHDVLIMGGRISDTECAPLMGKTNKVDNMRNYTSMDTHSFQEYRLQSNSSDCDF